MRLCPHTRTPSGLQVSLCFSCDLDPTRAVIMLGAESRLESRLEKLESLMRSPHSALNLETLLVSLLFFFFFFLNHLQGSVTQVGVTQVVSDTHVSWRNLTHQQPSYIMRRKWKNFIMAWVTQLFIAEMSACVKLFFF